MTPTRINQVVIYIRVSEKEVGTRTNFVTESAAKISVIYSVFTYFTFIYIFFHSSIASHLTRLFVPKNMFKHFRWQQWSDFTPTIPQQIHAIKNAFFFFFCFYNGSKDLLATWKIRCQNDETRVSPKTKDIHLSEFVCLHNTREDLMIQPCALH